MEIIKLKKVSNLLIADFKLGKEKLSGVIDSGCSHTMICETKLINNKASKNVSFKVDGVNGSTEHSEINITELSLGRKNGIVKDFSVINTGEGLMKRLTWMVYGEDNKKEKIHAIIGNDVLQQCDAILDFRNLTITLRK